MCVLCVEPIIKRRCSTYINFFVQLMDGQSSVLLTTHDSDSSASLSAVCVCLLQIYVYIYIYLETTESIVGNIYTLYSH